jgi:hypothetical protein
MANIRVRLGGNTAINLKNQSQNIKSITDIPDVDAIEVVNNALIIYNAATERYEVRLQDSSSATAAGANGYVQYNENDSHAASDGLIFTASSNTLTVGSASINSTNFTGTSNNALYLGGTVAASFQLNSTLSANVAALAANAATYLTGNGTIFVGNTTANVWANSTIITVANSSTSSNQTPAGFDVGIVVANASMVAVGSNSYINSSTHFSGNSTSNTYITSSGLYIANSTSNTKIQVPSAAEYSATNYFLHANGTWVQVTGGGGSGTPGGSNTYIQYNDSGSFNGTAGFTYDETTNNVTIANTLSIGGTTVNSTIYAGTSNNANYLGGTAAASYQLNSTLSANVSGLAANAATYLSGNGAIFVGNSTANISANSIQFAAANPTTTMVLTPASWYVGNSTANSSQNTTVHFIGNSTVSSTVNSTAFTGTANNALYLGGVAAADYQTEAGLSANVATLTSNNSLYLGGVSLATLQGTITANGDAAYNNAIAYAAANTYVNTYFAPKANPSFTGVLSAVDVTISGNLTVSGDVTYVNTTTLNVGDNIITLNADVPGGTAPTQNAGIEINRGSSANVQFVWNETDDRWTAVDQWLSANAIYLGNSTVSATANSTVYTGTSLLANNSAYLGGVVASGYQTTAGLAANVATLTANNANYLGGTAAASYQLNSTLAANVATLQANAATYLTGNGTIFVGNTTANITANSIQFAVINSTSNVVVTPGLLSVGNSTVNTYIDTNGLYIANSTSNTKIQVPSAAVYAATNYFLHANGTWVQVTGGGGGGGGTPGGSNTYIQYNDSGAFNGTAGFTYDETTNNVTIANTLSIGGTTVNSTIFNATANNANYLGGTAAASYQLNSTLAANVATLAANAATYLSGNGTIFVGNTTANITANSIQFAVTNSTANVVLTPLTISVGNSIANVWANSIQLNVANSTSNVVLTPVSGRFGNSVAYTLANTISVRTVNSVANVVIVPNSITVANSTANVVINPVSIAVGNSIANVWANSIQLNVANTTSNVVITPLTVSVGNSTVNVFSNSTIVDIQNATSNLMLSATSWAIGNSIANSSANTTVFFVGNSTVSATMNSTSFSGTSNNALYLGGTVASGYQTTAGLSANVATLTSNNALYLGGVAAASYQLNSTLAANVATLPANAATFLSGNGTIFVGNTTANITANSIQFAVTNSTSNVVMTPASISVGNSTVNSYSDQGGFYVANSTSNTKILVPSAAAYAATNYFLHANGTWVQVTGGGGTPGGSNTYIQFNDSTAFNGTDGFTFDKTTNNVTVANTLSIGGTVVNSTIFNATANNANYLGGTAAASYQLNSTLAANVATLPANAATFLTGNGTISVGNTTANLWANSIVLTVANSTASANHSPVGFVTGTVSQNSVGHFVGSAFVANSTNILTTGKGSFGTGALTTGQLNVNAASASTIGLIVRAAGSQTANTVEIQSSTGGPLATFGFDGHLAINKASVSTNTVFSIAGNNNERVDTTGTAYGIEATIINALAGNITVALFNGESRNTTTGAAVTGFQAGVIQNASGTMQRGTGAFISSPSVIQGNITTAYGLRVASQKSSANVATAYGISVEGATDNNYIAGALSLGGVVTAAANINVTGSGSFTVSANVGTDVSLSTTALKIGNSTVNSTANSLGLYLANSSSNTKIEVPSAAQRSGQYFLHANGSWTLVSASTSPSVNTMTTASSSLAWDSSAYDEYHITAQDANLTIAADAAASPVNGKKVLFYIKDNSTPRTLTWTVAGSKCFKAIAPLPTTTLAGKKLFVGAKYISSTDTWDVIAVSSET